MSNYNDPRLSILNVAQKSGIVLIRQTSNEEFMARCPFCGDCALRLRDNPTLIR